ncbi:methylated-DNA--[protein]-cysteine S-methyltransferase [Auraticoccus sp. F435]|uniref:Methylated-DNA--protein-cysteine methyltransferase n=1 Tax=Auraticoccus cholistanensis TaxID=2656650 RepID=A0A6A9UWU2_9ACTN|nr:methylated-DNA--[protein]-cysteine S-methyltransferase [Auraticoccus cholistanensis]MVA77416.1 methylated-DNA--[protein]-cysteine S-methyltransferase [Auraticoccus cholistanensis]
MTTTHTVLDSPLGPLTLVARDGALCAVLMSEHRQSRLLPGERRDADFVAAVRQLGEYFAGERREFELPLAPAGPPFDQRVWALLRRIPYGETRSYGDLARELGGAGFSQAVGRANGRNPLAVVVPCHRVVGADGSLTGYAGGLERKRALLHLENPARFGETLF